LAEDRDREIPGLFGGQVIDGQDRAAAFETDDFGQVGDRQGRQKVHGFAAHWRRVAPAIFRLQTQAERSADAPFRRQDRLPYGRLPRYDVEAGGAWDLGEDAGGDRVDEELELKILLGEGLHPDPGRRLPAVAEADGEPIALAQKPLQHTDADRA